MEWWRRTFGLHPVDMIIHFVAGGFIVVAVGEAAGNDAIALLATGGLFLSYAWRRQRAVAALPASGMSSGEVKLAELDAQAEEIHELRTRMLELEERLDFTERLLAQQREPAQLERPR
jgi:hypothetical protein